jgi:hypothetical protein
MGCEKKFHAMSNAVKIGLHPIFYCTVRETLTPIPRKPVKTYRSKLAGNFYLVSDLAYEKEEVEKLILYSGKIL